MAKTNPAALDFGHAPSHGKMSYKSGYGPPHKKNKKPLKSNITNKIKSKHIGANDVGEIEDDADGGGGDATEDTLVNEEDPDVLALSGAQQPLFEGAAPRLAGHEEIENDMMIETIIDDFPQAVAGATEDGADYDGDDDDYGGVEDFSDDERSDVGETRMLQVAEEDLVKEFKQIEAKRLATMLTENIDTMDLHDIDEADARSLGLLQESNSTSQEDDFFLNQDLDPFFGLSHDTDEYQQMWGAAESAVWRMPETVRSRESSDPTSANQKRVRFEETHETVKSPTPSATEDEDEDPNEYFPDLLTPEGNAVAQAGLNAFLEGMLPAVDLSDNESFYDFEDADEKLAFQIDEESDSDEDDASVIDTDDSGDTTDEEPLEVQNAHYEERCRLEVSRSPEPPAKATPKTPKTRRNLSRPQSAASSTGRGPRTGTFKVDPTRAAISTDVTDGKLKIVPPSKPLEKDKSFWERARTAASSREGSPRSSFHIVRSVSSDSMPARPFTARSTLGSMFDGNLDILRNNDTYGVAEDLFPNVLSRPQSSFSSFDGTENGVMAQHADVSMDDFVNIDDSETEVATSPTDTNMYSDYPTLPQESSNLFEHFQVNRSAIGAFRQNQNLAKHLSSQASHPAQRASTHEFNALQKGRRGAANTPITPARKKRASQDFTPSHSGVRKSMSSPLATHRRSRSRGNSLAHADLSQTFSRNPFVQ